MLGEIDVWNGLSHGLLLLINDILDLKNSEDKQGRVHGLEHRLETCVQVLPLSLQRHTRASLLESTAEAYRLAAWILLQESCREEFLGIALEKLERRREEEEEAILQLVEQVIGGLDYLPISWPLWPLFIASCVCVDEETQRRAFALFSLAAQKAPFENILRAQTVAQLVWQRRPRASLGVFPWQVVLQFLGWETSFA
ncbi:hypothetical protein ASPZODRAFT_137135 [Penicilliopsis zonata CBS 506.65]|uniref:Uncharacterized protein n=1 Tax=Penicilliopsis zonata CBS 506.65 TaxID=1073090 RepID=A0A1L9S6H5_9EURO|nr:hypothetical protein ASPZODRAFT_137135 [Penicilliopsis zonata CBS 506.65]OJJ42740.1 hypothetical protein ASPZODRAFT_137135 [Penicilliopsis zonata CBS 506.65]